MTEERFNPGDVVQLRSGSPPMTVRYQVGLQAAIDTGQALGVHVDWISVVGQHHQNVFAAEQLVRTAKEDKQ